MYNILSGFIPELTLILGPRISFGPSNFTSIFVIFGGLLLVFSFFCNYFADISLKPRLGLLTFGALLGVGFYAMRFITPNDVTNFFLPLILLGLFGVLWNFIDILVVKRGKNIFQKAGQSLLHLSLLIIVLGVVTSGSMKSNDLIQVQDGSQALIQNTNYEISFSNFNKTLPNNSQYLSIYEVQYTLTLESNVISEGSLFYRTDSIWGIDQKVQIISQSFDDIYIVMDFIFENDDTGLFESATIQVRYIPLIHVLWIGVILLLSSLLPLILRRFRDLQISI
jgi:cytochrome c biogenesis factor